MHDCSPDGAVPQSTTTRAGTWLHHHIFYTKFDTVSCYHHPLWMKHRSITAHVTCRGCQGNLEWVVMVTTLACWGLLYCRLSFLIPATGGYLWGHTGYQLHSHTESYGWESAGRNRQQVGHSQRHLQCVIMRCHLFHNRDCILPRNYHCEWSRSRAVWPSKQVSGLSKIVSKLWWQLCSERQLTELKADTQW